MNADGGLPPHVTVFERGWLSANNILFTGRDDTALVDSGYVTHAPQTTMLVGQALGERPLDRLLNTHLHSDHCGGNAALQARYPSLRTTIPPGGADAVRQWDIDRLSYRPTGQACPRFVFEELMSPGTEVMLADLAWQVHGAPGHDPDSVILFEPSSRTLISADALWEKGFGVVFPELIGEASFADVGETLDLIERLDPLCVIPGHGRVFQGVSAALSIARKRLEHLQAAPAKHARHAMKVLLKFKLLESQIMTSTIWRYWIDQTPYLETVRARFFPHDELNALCDNLLNELVAANSAAVENGQVRNV